MAAYAELHSHTNYSFLDGASWPAELVERAVELGYTALAVTDHDGFYGAVQFNEAARDTGLPAVYGAEIGMPLIDQAGSDDPIPGPGNQPELAQSPNTKRRGRIRQMHGSKPITVDPTSHLVLLAGTPSGYAALGELITRAQFRGEKDRPVYSWDDLATAARRGLIALTGCHQGAVPRAASTGDAAGARRELARLREIFGDRLYAELWDHAMPEDDPRNDLLAEVARQMRIPTVATNNVHYHTPDRVDLSEVLAAIGGRRSLDAGDGFRPATDERYLKSPDEMASRFAAFPGAVERAAELGAHLAFDLRLVAPRLPDFPMPGHFRSEMDYLRHLVFEGARDVYPDGAGGVDPRATERLEHELKIIDELGFPGYFLVVWDLVEFAKSRDIYCQIRGSGADSAVCRCIGLTRVDPIRLHLPFERFLSEERAGPPTSTSTSKPSVGKK